MSHITFTPSNSPGPGSMHAFTCLYEIPQGCGKDHLNKHGRLLGGDKCGKDLRYVSLRYILPPSLSLLPALFGSASCSHLWLGSVFTHRKKAEKTIIINKSGS